MAIATRSIGLVPAIEHLQDAIRERQLLRRKSARAALKVADRLLDQLELLALAKTSDVPPSLRQSIAAAEQAAIAAGVDRAGLDRECGVRRLMDDVFELEARLLRRCR
jgi:hypothetical protein